MPPLTVASLHTITHSRPATLPTPVMMPADGGIVVHSVGGELRQLEERRARVEQHLHAVARQQLAARSVFTCAASPSPDGNSGDLVFQIGDLSAHRLHVRLNFIATCAKSCLEHTHGRMLVLAALGLCRTSRLRSSRVQRGHQSGSAFRSASRTRLVAVG